MGKAKKIGVVGAGMMGAEIALSFALAGFETVLDDVNAELAAKGKERLSAVLDRRIKKGKLEASEKEGILKRITPTEDLADLADCDLVVEAALEVEEIKGNIFKQLDGLCKAETILASNTSSIAITKLAAAVSRERAKRFIGTHFNSPASVMKLVEVVPGLLTDEETTAEVTALLADIGKEPVKVKDVTGFALNRMFHVFYAEAMRLLEEGVVDSPEEVDKICLYGLGHPVGICKLLDTTGHDLNLMVDEILFDAYGERFRPSPVLQRMKDSGMLGRKSGSGFYDYTEKK